MTEISSFPSSGESNPPASALDTGRVNSQEDRSMQPGTGVNLGTSTVNPQNGMTRSDADIQGISQRLFDAALDMQRAGINVVPVKEDGSKAPDLPRWTKYQSQQTTGDQIWSWFGSDQKTGIGCIYGAVSGNTEMLEFEGRAVEEGILDEVTDLMENSGFASVWEAITTGWVDQSPSGGLHFRFRVEGDPVKGNTKLASREAREDELTADERELKQRRPDKVILRTLIETRGEGGFGVCAPSHGKVHDTGRPYVRLHGGPGTIPVIDAETYEAIHHICQAADQTPKQEAPQWRGRPLQVPDGELRPGDDYNQRADLPDLLGQHGWSFVYQRGDAQYWSRPGKNKGISASLNYRGNGKLYVFTSSTEFDNERAYTPFSAYTVLEHAGNYSNAAKELRRQGYGSQRSASVPVPSPRQGGGDFAQWLHQIDDSDRTPPPPDIPEAERNDPQTRSGEPGTYSSPDAPMRVARELEPSWIQGSSRTLHHWRDQWMRWTGTHWVEVGTSALKSSLYLKLEHAIFYAPNKKGEMEPKPWNPSIKKIAALSEAIAAVTHLDERIETGEWLGPHKGGPRLVSCKNVMIDPVTRETRPHTPAYFTTTSVPYAYDPEAKCPQWLEFLNIVFPNDPQSQQLLQEWMGYVISGWTHYQKGMQLIGPPRAGKGTIARMIEKLIGSENAVGSTLASLITNFGLQPLLGKSLCVIGDAKMENRNSSEVVARVLSITGEDALPVDRKNRAPWSGRLPVRLMILANKAPRFNDSSGAATGRFMTLHFTQSFAGREDKTLETRLTTELAGILNWALEGLKRLDERGHFVQPESASDIIESQREESAPHQAFIDQSCVTGPDHWITKDTLYARWAAWCEFNNMRAAGSKATFAAELYAAVPGIGQGFKRVNGKLTRVYTGVTADVEAGFEVPKTQSSPRRE